MLHNFQEVMEQVKKLGRKTMSVAAAQDKEVLEAVKASLDADLAAAILVGDEKKIRPLMAEVGLPAATPVVDEQDIKQAALTAVSLVKKGEAQVLMKGLVNSSIFLKAVLNEAVGLRTGHLLSHLAVLEIPGQPKLQFYSDGGMNVAPKLAEKKDILCNSLQVLYALGIDRPKVAILTANEMVSPKMVATVDAQALAEAAEREGLCPGGVVEGPIALDVALCPEAAKHKGIQSKVSGDVDLFIMPNIESGNILCKSLQYYMRAKMAGMILGASHPIVMSSRADNAVGKLHSIALACLAASKKGR